MKDIRRLITIFDLLNRLWIKWGYGLNFFKFMELLFHRISNLNTTTSFPYEEQIKFTFDLDDDVLIVYLNKLLE